MADTTNNLNENWLQRFKRARRKRIKTFGKRLIRGLADFLGSQSTVGDAPVLDSKHFPFLASFTDNWQAIHAEIVKFSSTARRSRCFRKSRPTRCAFPRAPTGVPSSSLVSARSWRRIASRRPSPRSLLEAVPELQTAWFSILGPGYHIPAHRGVTKGILRAHLGLIIPRDAEKCRMRVGDTINVWRPGEIFVFDDTYEHEVWNDTADERVILLFDFNRPMRFWGRLINATFVRLLKLTAYYQEPKQEHADLRGPLRSRHPPRQREPRKALRRRLAPILFRQFPSHRART